MSSANIQLACAGSVTQVAQLYSRTGRVHIHPALDAESAQWAYRSLAQEVPWQLHLNDEGKSYDLAQEQVSAMPATTRSMLFDRVHANARNGFQYFFDNFPLSDAHAANQHMDLFAMRVFEFLNSPPFLSFVRRVTGRDDIAYADAQATAYRSGHFLTRHDDTAPGKGRIAAYVLNLTPQWRADWGGILNFLDGDGHVAEGYTPVFNALNLFKVPQPHAVSYVTPFAAGPRLSISGWLRSGAR